MGSSWFLNLALQGIDLFSRPLLALGYPLCASIQAIENDSHSDTCNLISYWILLSLIYLFEYAFLKLLQWFQYWPYMKIMIIAWLVIPDFGRASYVYNRLVHSCISMNPQAVISKFRNWKKLFVKEENFLLQAEKYITENGTDALEKLIASKNTAQNVYAERIKAVLPTEKTQIQQSNKVWLHMEQKDIEDLEMIEKEEVPKDKQEKIEKDVCVKQILDETSGRDQVMRNVCYLQEANTASCNLKSNENKSFAIPETKGMAAKNTAGEESPQSSASKNVQKEWTCAICQVTTTNEKTLNIHLQGRKHKAACEALNTKNQFSQVKNDRSNEESEKMTDTANAWKQKSTTNQHSNKEQKNTAQNVYAETIKAVPPTEKTEMQQSNKVWLHMEQKYIKDLEMTEKEEVPEDKKEKIEKDVCVKQVLDETSGRDQVMRNANTASCNLKSNENKSFAIPETKGMAAKNTAGEESPQSSATKNAQKEWTCAICQMTTTSEKTLNIHLQGRKHKAACEALNAKNQFSQVKNNRSNEESEKMTDTANALKQKSTTNQHSNKEQKNVQILNVQEHVKPKIILSYVPNLGSTKDQENKSKPVHANTSVQELQKNVGTSAGLNNSRFRCDVCNVKCTSEIDLASHLMGRKHLANFSH